MPLTIEHVVFSVSEEPDWRIVLPAIDPVMTAGFVESIAEGLRWRVIVIDNCAAPLDGLGAVRLLRFAHNVGVAASWNAGVAAARGEGASHVLLASASVRFGKAGASDVGEVCAQASKWGTVPAPAFWHTLITTVAWWDRVGPADEFFFPAYYEDTDLLRRSVLAGCVIPQGGTLDARGLRDGHGVDRLRADFSGLSTINYEALKARWRAKWGCHENDAANMEVGFTHPFGDPDHDWSYAPKPASIPWLHSHYGIVGR